MLLAVFLKLRIEHSALRSTTSKLPLGLGDTAYSIQSQGRAEPDQPPDLAIEVVVSHPEAKALRAGASLKIPEMWVLDLQGHRLTFYHLAVRGKAKGAYKPEPRSRAFPVLTSAEVLERLDDAETDDTAFHENCRAWARRVLVPRRRPEIGPSGS